MMMREESGWGMGKKWCGTGVGLTSLVCGTVTCLICNN